MAALRVAGAAAVISCATAFAVLPSTVHLPFAQPDLSQVAYAHVFENLRVSASAMFLRYVGVEVVTKTSSNACTLHGVLRVINACKALPHQCVAFTSSEAYGVPVCALRTYWRVPGQKGCRVHSCCLLRSPCSWSGVNECT